MKKLFFYSLFFALSALAAQHDSRFVSSLIIGQNIATPAINAPGVLEKPTARLAVFETHYRIARFLDLGLQFGYQREEYAILPHTLERWRNDDFVTTKQPISNNYFIGLQPRFNYRLGQGDLSLSLTYGISRNDHRVHIAIPERTAVFTMQRLSGNYLQLRLAYTYWLSRGLGLEIGLIQGNNFQNWSDDNISALPDGMPTYRFTEVVDYLGSFFEDTVNLGDLESPVRKATYTTLTLGVSYRW